MEKKYFIRAKGGTWQEFTETDIHWIDVEHKHVPPAQLEALMALRFGIVGDFEIEVRVLESGYWIRQRGSEGTTTILKDGKPRLTTLVEIQRAGMRDDLKASLRSTSAAILTACLLLAVTIGFSVAAVNQNTNVLVLTTPCGIVAVGLLVWMAVRKRSLKRELKQFG